MLLLTFTMLTRKKRNLENGKMFHVRVKEARGL